MSWSELMNSIFGSAAPPPPVRMSPVPGSLTKVPAGAAVLLPLPSPVPGCDASTWSDYEALMALREGVKYRVYYDSRGKPTGGEGHLVLPSDGLKVGDVIPDATVRRWFTHDGASAMDTAITLAKQAGIPSQAFLPYLASACYQLGNAWTKEFPNTWRMIVAGNYKTAAAALYGTPWQKETPVRVTDFQTALQALPPKATA